MAYRILKYELSRLHPIQMPANAILLSVGFQGLVPFVWAIVNEDAPLVLRDFKLLMTGAETTVALRVAGRFVGTIQREGPFVYHIFDMGETQP